MRPGQRDRRSCEWRPRPGYRCRSKHPRPFSNYRSKGVAASRSNARALSVFEKLARLYSREKIILGKKAVIFAVDFACARRTGGAGNGINEIGCLPKCVAQRGFTRARWGGDDK